MVKLILSPIEKKMMILQYNTMTKKIAFIIIFLLFATGLFADGENLTIKVAVLGPGSEVYFWWGHIALIVEDSETGRSRFYDYGLFSFDNENFYYNFAYGRLLYSTGASPTERNIDLAVERNRSLIFYTLDLPPESRVIVRDFLENNVLPENRDYYYQHFYDNCSTRIRDVIDLATNGQFKEKYNVPGKFTLRDHVRRHTWFSPAADWVLNFWMGQVIDTKITEWDDMFLPAEVGKRINDFWYTDINGERRKLVMDEEIIFESTGRPIVLDTPRKQWPVLLVFSIVLSAVFGLFFYLYSKKILVGKILAGISMSFCGLVFGLAGLALYFLSIFTNHDYTYENANMIFSGPILLLVIPLGLSYAFTKKPEKQITYDLLLRLLWLSVVLGIFISMVIKLLPGFYQKNLPDQMLMLPIALLFTFQPVGLNSIIDKYLRPKKNKKQKRGKHGRK